MPKFNSQTLEQHQNPTGHFGFSAVKLEDLGATEYTLVTIILDESGSTSPFKDDMEKCIQAAVKACCKSPRADNLLLRLVAFGTNMREVHGFKLLEQCDPADYIGVYQCAGSTALYDSTENGIQSSLTFGEQLSRNDYTVNGIVFVLTDGDDNVSTLGCTEVKTALHRCVTTESMESLISILIGVNVKSNYIAQYLDNFHKQAGFTQYIKLEDANADTLANLADFISKSISSQSQALGTGGASQSLTF
jgi:hypothetical protein